MPLPLDANSQGTRERKRKKKEMQDHAYKTRHIEEEAIFSPESIGIKTDLKKLLRNKQAHLDPLASRCSFDGRKVTCAPRIIIPYEPQIALYGFWQRGWGGGKGIATFNAQLVALQPRETVLAELILAVYRWHSLVLEIGIDWRYISFCNINCI